MTTQEKEKQIREYIDAYNHFDIAGMLANLHEEIHFKNISNGEITLETKGKDAFKIQAEQAKNFFTEREQKIEQLDIKGDKVEVSIDYKGKLAIDLPNSMKAGDWLLLKGKSIFYFAEGKIIGIEDIS